MSMEKGESDMVVQKKLKITVQKTSAVCETGIKDLLNEMKSYNLSLNLTPCNSLATFDSSQALPHF